MEVHPNPAKERRGGGGGTLRGAFSSPLRGFKLAPSKWRYLVPPMLRNTPKGHNASRWVLECLCVFYK